MTTFKEYFLSNADDIWPTSQKHQDESIDRALRFCSYERNGLKQLTDIRPSDIRSFLKSLDDDGMTPATVNRYAAAISKVFKYALEEGDIEKAPVIKYRKEPDGRPRVFTKEEKECLVWFLQRSRAPWMADMAILSLQTGMRLGEIIKIGTKHSKLDQSGPMPVLTLFNTKNGDPRDVPLNEVAKAAYDRLAGMHGGFWSSRIFYDVWNEARHRIARGDKHFVFHTCRHSAATQMANLNINTTLIGKFLGHRSAETTKKYIHLEDKASMEIANAMMGAQSLGKGE